MVAADMSTRPTVAAQRPLERAQLVWQRARELVDRVEQHDRFAVALELLRVSHHDPTQMTHALSLAHTHVRAHPGDAVARAGVRILERAIAFLGVKPAVHDVKHGAARRSRP
jgi:hypothetical protein